MFLGCRRKLEYPEKIATNHPDKPSIRLGLKPETISCEATVLATQTLCILKHQNYQDYILQYLGLSRTKRRVFPFLSTVGFLTEIVCPVSGYDTGVVAGAAAQAVHHKYGLNKRL